MNESNDVFLENGKMTADYMRIHVEPKNTNKIFMNPFSKLLVVARGNVIYTIGSKVVHLGDQSVVYTADGQIYNPFVQSDKLYERYKINFHSEDILPMDRGRAEVRDVLSHSFAKNLGEADFAEVYKHSRAVFELMAHANDPLALTMARAELLLAVLKAASAPERIDDSRVLYIDEVIRYLNERLDKKITLDSVAAEFFISKSKLIYDFKAHTQMTVSDYLTMCRIDRAKELLSGGYAVSTVSEMCGFSSPSYFIKVFSSVVGKTPFKYYLKV